MAAQGDGAETVAGAARSRESSTARRQRRRRIGDDSGDECTLLCQVAAWKSPRVVVAAGHATVASCSLRESRVRNAVVDSGQGRSDAVTQTGGRRSQMKCSAGVDHESTGACSEEVAMERASRASRQAAGKAEDADWTQAQTQAQTRRGEARRCWRWRWTLTHARRPCWAVGLVAMPADFRKQPRLRTRRKGVKAVLGACEGARRGGIGRGCVIVV